MATKKGSKKTSAAAKHKPPAKASAKDTYASTVNVHKHKPKKK
jgi:hypothetical protein